MDLDAFLSPHFRLRELVVSNHRTIDNTPPGDIVDRLAALCETLLEPIRTEFGPLIVSSGYRCPALNLAVGGSPTSEHVGGCAADFMPMDRVVTVAMVVRWVRSSGLPFDQVIDEGAHSNTTRWVHVGMVRSAGDMPRREVLAYRDGRRVPYV